MATVPDVYDIRDRLCGVAPGKLFKQGKVPNERGDLPYYTNVPPKAGTEFKTAKTFVLGSGLADDVVLGSVPSIYTKSADQGGGQEEKSKGEAMPSAWLHIKNPAMAAALMDIQNRLATELVTSGMVQGKIGKQGMMAMGGIAITTEMALGMGLISAFAKGPDDEKGTLYHSVTSKITTACKIPAYVTRIYMATVQTLPDGTPVCVKDDDSVPFDASLFTPGDRVYGEFTIGDPVYVKSWCTPMRCREFIVVKNGAVEPRRVEGTVTKAEFEAMTRAHAADVERAFGGGGGGGGAASGAGHEETAPPSGAAPIKTDAGAWHDSTTKPHLANSDTVPFVHAAAAATQDRGWFQSPVNSGAGGAGCAGRPLFDASRMLASGSPRGGYAPTEDVYGAGDGGDADAGSGGAGTGEDGDEENGHRSKRVRVHVPDLGDDDSSELVDPAGPGFGALMQSATTKFLAASE